MDPAISTCRVKMMVCGSSHDRRTKIKTRFKNGKRLRVIHKLDEEQVRWIIRQKHNGLMSNTKIADSMGVSARRVMKLWSRHRYTRPESITYPPQMGRPTGVLAGHRALCSDPVVKRIDEWQSGLRSPLRRQSESISTTMSYSGY